MAVVVDWPNYDIQISKDYTSLVQSSPTEIRLLDTNLLRKDLRDLEDGEDGRAWPVTHDHNEDVLVGGIELADVLLIRPPYVVTMEDGQYAVILQGTNNNILDRNNKNQVSLSPTNSAGLVNSQAIEAGEYSQKVTIWPARGVAGSLYPIGTFRRPSNNVPDSVVIAAFYGFLEFFIVGDYTLDTGDDVSNMTVRIGAAPTDVMTVNPGANCINTRFIGGILQGTLDGGSRLLKCSVLDINYVNGRILASTLEGTITLGGGALALIQECVTGADLAEIDCGGSGQELRLMGHVGDMYISNKSGIDDVHIQMVSGNVILKSTVTGGNIYANGTGRLIDEAGNSIPTGTWNGATIFNYMADGAATLAILEDLVKLNGYDVSKSGDIITIWLDNVGGTIWREYDLANGGRVLQ